MSPTSIVLDLAQPFFNTMRDCSNSSPAINMSMKDIYCYHAVLTLMTYVKLEVEAFFQPNGLIFDWKHEVATLNQMFNINKYYWLRSKLKLYMPEDIVPGASRGVKIKRGLRAVQESFRNVMDCPGEMLSVDEGMAQASRTRNPIYTSLGKAKPLEGFRDTHPPLCTS
jgi:hypothetical protein